MPDQEPVKDPEFEKFLSAWNVFAHDLSLVGAENRLRPQDPFFPPLDPIDADGEHNYHLTILQGSRDEVLSQLKKIKVIALCCMDWRFASNYYEHIQEECRVLPENIMFIGLGGGAVQMPEDRQTALTDIFSFLSKNCPQLEYVYLSGHTDRCGAVAHWLHAAPGELPRELGNKKGGLLEVEKMTEKLKTGAGKLKPAIKPSVRIETDLLSLAGTDEQNHWPTITLSRIS